jgi:hypothetical protein
MARRKGEARAPSPRRCRAGGRRRRSGGRGCHPFRRGCHLGTARVTVLRGGLFLKVTRARAARPQPARPRPPALVSPPAPPLPAQPHHRGVPAGRRPVSRARGGPRFRAGEMYVTVMATPSRDAPVRARAWPGNHDCRARAARCLPGEFEEKIELSSNLLMKREGVQGVEGGGARYASRTAADHVFHVARPVTRTNSTKDIPVVRRSGLVTVVNVQREHVRSTTVTFQFYSFL